MNSESKTTKAFIITCGHEALHYDQKQLWSCSGTTVTVFQDRKLAHNAVRTTIRRRKRQIENGEINDDNKFAKPQCYATHELENANDGTLHKMQR